MRMSRVSSDLWCAVALDAGCRRGKWWNIRGKHYSRSTAACKNFARYSSTQPFLPINIGGQQNAWIGAFPQERYWDTWPPIAGEKLNIHSCRSWAYKPNTSHFLASIADDGQNCRWRNRMFLPAATQCTQSWSISGNPRDQILSASSLAWIKHLSGVSAIGWSYWFCILVGTAAWLV
jgi:hypothetical protein